MKKSVLILSFACVATAVLLSLSGCHKENFGEKSGTITYGENVFTVSIGEISKDDQGNLTVELTGNLIGGFIIIQGNMKPYLGMRIIVDGKTLEYDSANISAGCYTYYFKTGKNPSRIIVYSNDGSNSTLSFDGKKKTVIY